MISPSFVEELERQRGAARADLAHALAAGDDSGAVPPAPGSPTSTTSYAHDRAAGARV